MQAWAQQEMQYLCMQDARLTKRTILTMEHLANRPGASVPTVCETWAATKATYRLWANPKVQPREIIEAHGKRTHERCRGQETVLVIQDTSSYDFTGREGMGYLDGRYGEGLKVHTSLCVSTEGVPLGIIGQKVWARGEAERGKRERRKERALKDKESYRWIEAFEATAEALPKGVRQVTIADREADMYDLFAAPRRSTDHLLIRGTHDRRITVSEGRLQGALQSLPVADTYRLEVGRRKGQPPRTATIAVRYGTFTLKRTRHHKDKGLPETVTVQAILATEQAPPAGVPPIQWLLLTTLPVHTVADALQCIGWYSFRWLVERYHYVLKSGCAVEQLQVEDAENIQRALAMYSVVAWHLLWLTYTARLYPDRSCETALRQEEWTVLFMTHHKTSCLPAQPPSCGEAILWIAQLGGFLGRTRDGEPGVKTLWRGYRALQEKVELWTLMSQRHQPQLSTYDVGNA